MEIFVNRKVQKIPYEQCSKRDPTCITVNSLMKKEETDCGNRKHVMSKLGYGLSYLTL